MWVNVTASLIEAGGLLLVIAVGLRYWGTADLFETPFSNPDAGMAVALVFVVQGVVLTFFSFLGFEDTLNVAEEVKNPSRTLPLGPAARAVHHGVPLCRRGDHGGVGRAVARARAGGCAARRSHGARGALVSRLGLSSCSPSSPSAIPD